MVVFFVMASLIAGYVYKADVHIGGKEVEQIPPKAALPFISQVPALFGNSLITAQAAEEQDISIDFLDEEVFPASFQDEGNIQIIASPLNKKDLDQISFARPSSGINQRNIHANNGVDFSGSCNSAIYAAAQGIVVRDTKLGNEVDGWNGGYGNQVLLRHNNGIETRYAHLSKILVSFGDVVKKGQKIGLMGETGESTGCHLHFEVHGAKNPFGRK